MNLRIRPIEIKDVSKKVEWYNNSEITKFLHYEELFTYEGTLEWVKKLSFNKTRYENIIEVIKDNQWIPVGVVGLFEIDKKNKKAGSYITIGELKYQGLGIAKKAMLLILQDAFIKFNLNKVYAYTDSDNIKSQKLHEKIGFIKEGVLRQELFYKGKYIDRVYYSILKKEFLKNNIEVESNE